MEYIKRIFKSIVDLFKEEKEVNDKVVQTENVDKIENIDSSWFKSKIFYGFIFYIISGFGVAWFIKYRKKLKRDRDRDERLVRNFNNLYDIKMPILDELEEVKKMNDGINKNLNVRKREMRKIVEKSQKEIANMEKVNLKSILEIKKEKIIKSKKFKEKILKSHEIQGEIYKKNRRKWSERNVNFIGISNVFNLLIVCTGGFLIHKITSEFQDFNMNFLSLSVHSDSVLYNHRGTNIFLKNHYNLSEIDLRMIGQELSNIIRDNEVLMNNEMIVDDISFGNNISEERKTIEEIEERKSFDDIDM